MCGTGPFFGGSGCRAVAYTRPAFPKMPPAPSEFPLLWAPQAPGDDPPWRGKSSDRDWSAVFDDRPIQRAYVAQGLFLVGPSAGAERDRSASLAAKSLSSNNGEKSPLWWDR